MRHEDSIPLTLVAIVALAAACDIPRDPRNTLASVSGDTLHVGVSEAPPWVVRRGDEPVGVEPELVRRFARSIDAEVRWSWGPAPTVDREPDETLVENAVASLEALDWVEAADVRLHEEGALVAGEGFVVPRNGESVTLAQLQEASSAVNAVDWKVYDIVVTAVETVEPRRSPDGERTVR